MKEQKTRIEQVIAEIEEVTELLYQQKIDQGYAKLNTTIGNIMEIVKEIYRYKAEGHLDFDEKKLMSSLTEAVKAMEEKDYVLLADILSYEIIEQLNDCVKMD